MRGKITNSEKKAAYLGNATFIENEIDYFAITIKEQEIPVKERMSAQDARRRLHHFLECEKLLKENSKEKKEWRLARKEQIELMMGFFTDASFCISCCDRFILIEQLLKKEEKLRKNKRRSKKEGSSKGIEMAKDLLHNPLASNVILHAPLSISSLTFVEEMINRAETLASTKEGSAVLLDASRELTDVFSEFRQSLLQELRRIYPLQEGQIKGRKVLSIWQGLCRDPELVDLYRKFEGQWLIFTALSLKHKLYLLIGLSADEMEERLAASMPYEGCMCRLPLDSSFAGMSS